MDGDGRGEPALEEAAHYYVDDRIQYIREFLASKGVDFDRPCTFDTHGDCWLAGTLPPWNKILSAVCLELIELQPATLCLRSNGLYSTGNTSVETLHYGAYLFKWLPEQHACVQSIFLAKSRSCFGKALFTMALPSIAHLRHLTLEGGYWTTFSELNLCDGMAAFKTLETVEFLELAITSDDLAHSIATLLRENGRHLVKVRFKRNFLSQPSAAVILKALLKCHLLSELSFDDNHLNKRNIESLDVVVRSLRNLKKLTLDSSFSKCEYFGPIAKALESNTSLEELSLKGYKYKFELLFEVLHTNTTLRLLDLEACKMTFSEALHLDTVLTFNKGMRTVNLSHCLLHVEGIVVLANALANAMAINDTLEKLDLTDTCYTIQGVMAFCRCLKNNRTLRSVAFGSIMASDQDRMELSHQMSQHKWYGRIALSWVIADLTPLTMALKADAQSLEELHLYDVNDELLPFLLCPLFDALASNTMVRTLKLKVVYCNRRLVEALRNALISNRSIKSLELNLYMDMDSFEWHIICDVYEALLVNTTVVELTLTVSEMKFRHSKLFAKMLRQNRTLTSIALSSVRLSGKPLNMISRGIVENNIVTSFACNQLPGNRASLRIREAIGRNVSLLNLAVKFVMRTMLTKSSAQAFETLRVVPSLVSQLSKVSGKSEQEALAAIQAADRYIRSHYLYLTGVVKFSVECHPSAQTQADALNDYCWQAIAQFLKVSDVRDE
ncbi:hypothetical protein HPB52_014381 [Rhipicephalus sanguineus]|uniref:Protein nlrc3 n=1 Tax=Rhipicephalus sanguineus TaxID=34632 RepID=A0A9D4T7V2_RHISA|nr:hypothetical protein HPB52_014381 [Rhipicephalus sanguineus]